MKQSETPTQWLLIKAQICSEWDSCDSCLIELSEKDIEDWKKWNESATKLQQESEYRFAHLQYYYTTEFLNGYEEVLEDKLWCFVDLEDQDVDDLERPEQRVDTHMIKLYGDGSFCFVGYGKHTSEEFWTDSINIKELSVEKV